MIKYKAYYVCNNRSLTVSKALEYTNLAKAVKDMRACTRGNHIATPHNQSYFIITDMNGKELQHGVLCGINKRFRYEREFCLE